MTRDWIDYDEAEPGGRERIAGTVKVLKSVESRELGNARDILVYLPPSYPVANRTYPALYMHDGQNLFDPATSFAGEWGVDETLEALSDTSPGQPLVELDIPAIRRKPARSRRGRRRR